MTRQLESVLEERQARRTQKIINAVEYGLQGAIEREGGEYHGFAAKITPVECLLVLKVTIAGRRQVAFVGAEDLGSALIKAVYAGQRGELRWRVDQYGGES